MSHSVDNLKLLELAQKLSNEAEVLNEWCKKNKDRCLNSREGLHELSSNNGKCEGLLSAAKDLMALVKSCQ